MSNQDGWVEWREPYGEGPEPIMCRMSVEDAIAVSKRTIVAMGHPVPTDEHALAEFLVVHWAERIPPETEERNPADKMAESVIRGWA